MAAGTVDLFRENGERITYTITNEHYSQQYAGCNDS